MNNVGGDYGTTSLNYYHFRKGKMMTEPKIMRVDRETYNLGKRLPHFWSSNKELKFYEIRCNWGINRQTQAFYHVLAYSRTQAEEMAKKEYARTHYITEKWVVIF